MMANNNSKRVKNCSHALILIVGVIVWGDTSPISGRMLTNLSMTNYLGQPDQDNLAFRTLLHTNVLLARIKVLDFTSFNM